MSKKKKHIQTEKELLHQEEAARLRAEKAERERMQNRRTVAFALGAILYVVDMATLLAVKKSSFKKRALAIWLPLFGLCAACVLLFWVGLPLEGFAAVFGRVRGAIGFTVLAGIALVLGTLDGLLSRRG